MRGEGGEGMGAEGREYKGMIGVRRKSSRGESTVG